VVCSIAGRGLKPYLGGFSLMIRFGRAARRVVIEKKSYRSGAKSENKYSGEGSLGLY
jgi:hypothetical protein